MGGKKRQEKLEKLSNLMKMQHIKICGVHTFTKYLTSSPQNCQDHQKQGKSEKWSQRNLKRHDDEMLCVPWMGSWDKKRAFGKNLGNPHKVWTLVNNDVSVFVH